MSEIEIFYTHFDIFLAIEKWENYLGGLPPHFQQKIKRFRRWQDQHASLLSYLLLQHALVKMGYSTDCLEHIEHDEYGRPSISPEVDFNLSHSGEYVVCALMKGGRGGIDIEHIKPIDIVDFKSYMTLEEWSILTLSQDSYKKFYDYWTIKESVMKADGRGLYIPLQDIFIQGECALLYGKTWFLKEVPIDKRYACHLATHWENPVVNLHEMRF